MKIKIPLLILTLVLLFNIDLKTQEPLDIPLAFNGTILNLTNFNGVNYITGNFTQVGKITGSLVSYNTITNTRNINFPKVNGRINAIEPDGIGGIYIGGEFTRVGNFSRNHLAHIDMNGNVTPWNPDVNLGRYPFVYDIKKIDTMLIIAGSFDGINNVYQPYLATLSLDGALIPWNLIPNDEVYTIASHGDQLFIGGAFLSINGEEHNKIASIDINGNLLPFYYSANNSVKKILIENDTIFVAGSFTRFNGLTRNRVAAFEINGNLLDWAPNVNGSVETIEYFQNKIIIGGKFTVVNFELMKNLAALDLDNNLVPWYPKVDNYVFSLEKFNDKLYIGGNFSSLLDMPRSGIAVLDANFGLNEFNPKANGGVFAINLFNNNLCFAGVFTSVEGVDRRYIAAIDDNGNVLDWYPKVNYPVYTIYSANNVIYISGYFDEVNGEFRNHIAALNEMGDLLPWAPNLDKPAFAIHADIDKIYLAGRFTTINDTSRNYIATVDYEGNLTSWAPKVDNQINSIEVSENNIYIGGFFKKVNGLVRNHFASFDINGNLSPFAADFDNTINSIKLLDNNLYIGGWFNHVNSIERNRLAALDMECNLLDWNPNADNTVWKVISSSFAGGIIYVCGDFDTLGGLTRNYLAATNKFGVLQPWAPNPDNSVFTVTLSETSIYTGGNFRNVGNIIKPSFAGYYLQLVLPDAAILLNPSTDSLNVRINPTFNWISGLNATKYHVQISLDSLFNNLIYDNPNFIGTEFISDSLLLNYNTKYYWHVRSKNKSGFSDFTDTWNFKTIIAPPAIPNLTEPADLSENIFLTPLFKWSFEPFALLYHIQVATDSSFTDIIMNDSLVSTNQKKMTPMLHKLSNYFWKVKVKNINSWSDWSSIFTFKTAETQLLSIYLKQGWNLISSNIVPQSDSLELITAEIVDNLTIMKNGTGKTYIPQFNINSIKKWNLVDGYQVYMTKADTLNIIGVPVDPETTPINLKLGWNVISYLRTNPMDAVLALSPITDNSNLVICKNGQGLTYIPAFDLNTIGNMLPGQGYQIYVSTIDTLYYPSNSLGKLSPNQNYDLENSHLLNKCSNTGNNSTLVMHDLNMSDGTEVGVINSLGDIVGSGKFMNNFASMSISGDNSETPVLDGAQSNEILNIVYFDKKSNKINEYSNLSFKDQLNDRKLENLSYKQNSLILANAINNLSDLSIYPNPAKTKINLDFISKSEHYTLKVFDITGKLVFEINNSNLIIGFNSIVLDISHLVTGSYSIIINSENIDFFSTFIKE